VTDGGSDVCSDGTEQLSFTSKEEKIHKVLELAGKHNFDRVIGLLSGGTDSLFAIDAYERFHNEHGLPPIDVAVQTNTGATIPQTLETAREFCHNRGLAYAEISQPNPDRMLAPRVLENGWPSERTHGFEFINRKQDTWDAVYSSFPGRLLFISGGRVAESDRRAANLGDGAVDIGETGDRRPRQSWVAPCHGLLDSEKEAYIEEYGIPETIAYDVVGYSGDCVACSFDDPRVVNEIEILSPELAYALRRVVVWVYQRIRRGDIDQPIERAVWGTKGIEEGGDGLPDPDQTAFDFGGCSSCTKSCYTDGGRSLHTGTDQDGGDR
jgi:3'-phosphoadenosine 5'-phosphosulfate sulfotransferase (PAPS reductase)/FAD synthetase